MTGIINPKIFTDITMPAKQSYRLNIGKILKVGGHRKKILYGPFLPNKNRRSLT
jgi:hypothetical protein